MKFKSQEDKPDDDLGSFVMPFGKFYAHSLDEIASTNEGLLYLDWCVGDFDEGDVLTAIKNYLSNPGVQRELDQAINERDSKPPDRGWHGDKGWWSK